MTLCMCGGNPGGDSGSCQPGAAATMPSRAAAWPQKHRGAEHLRGRGGIDVYGLAGINAGPMRARRAAYQHCQTEAETGIYETENVYALQKLSKHNRAGERAVL